MSICSGNLFDKAARVGNTQTIRPESTQTHNAEILIPQHNRVGRAPFHVRELLCIDKVNFGFKWRIKAILPRSELRQDRRIPAVDRVPARPENIGHLSLKDKNRGLRLADYQLGAILYLLSLDRKPVNHRVTRVIKPFDDLDKLIQGGVFYFVKNTHLRFSFPKDY